MAQKIDYKKLNEMVHSGVMTKDIAAHFGVTSAAISRAKRRFNVAVARDSANREAPAEVDRSGTAMDSLMGLIDRCERELSWIDMEVPQPTIHNHPEGMTPAEIDRHTAAISEEYREWQNTKLKHVAEIRKIIKTLGDLRLRFFHQATVEKALLIMFKEISRESPECQRRIRNRLERASIILPVDDQPD